LTLHRLAAAPVEEPVPFATDPEASVEWDDMYVSPEKSARVKDSAHRKPVQEYVPEIRRQNIFVETPKDLVPAENLRELILNLAQTTPRDLQNVLQSLDPEEIEGGPALYEWLMKLNDGTVNQQDSEVHLQALERQGSAWRQRLQGKTHIIAPAYKRLDLSHIQPKMSGADAVDLFLQGTGIGRSVRWPLYRTGIWINIRPASLTYLAEIDRSLSFERAQLGMDTSGLINSNDSLIFDEKLTDAALRLVTWTNVDVASPMDLKAIIATQDIPSLIMAMAAATLRTGSAPTSPAPKTAVVTTTPSTPTCVVCPGWTVRASRRSSWSSWTKWTVRNTPLRRCGNTRRSSTSTKKVSSSTRARLRIRGG
jgi:hypothetical protein